MIFHITFTTGANPLVFYGPADRLCKEWKRVKRKDPTARCDFFGLQKRPLHCMMQAGNGYAVGRYFDGAHKTKHYTYLLPALKAVERGHI